MRGFVPAIESWSCGRQIWVVDELFFTGITRCAMLGRNQVAFPLGVANFDGTILMPPGRLRSPGSCYTYSSRHHYPRRYPIRVHLPPFQHRGPRIVHLFASNIPLLVKIIDFDVVFFCFFQNTAQKLAFYSVPKFRNLTELFRRNPSFFPSAEICRKRIIRSKKIPTTKSIDIKG